MSFFHIFSRGAQSSINLPLVIGVLQSLLRAPLRFLLFLWVLVDRVVWRSEDNIVIPGQSTNLHRRSQPSSSIDVWR